VPCCQRYTPTDCFFGDFAQWVIALQNNISFHVNDYNIMTVLYNTEMLLQMCRENLCSLFMDKKKT